MFVQFVLLKKLQLKNYIMQKMDNLIGNEISIYRKKKFTKNQFFYDYFKKEIKDKRKMGHLTTIFSK